MRPTTSAEVARGIAYVDFGFIEPALLAATAKTRKDGQVAPKGIEGELILTLARGWDVLAQLHQQIQQVLLDLRISIPKQKLKSGEKT